MSRTINDLSVWNKPLIDTWQYCSTSRTNQALRSLANAGFQNRGVCLQAFPSSPSPSLLFHFLALISFFVRPETVFLCSETKWKRLLRRLIIPRFWTGLLFMAKIHSLTYQGPVIWSKLDISIRSSKSFDLFKKRIKLVNFTSLLDSTCKDCFFM